MKTDSFNCPPSLKHLRRLTTPKGLFQHSKLDSPDPNFGYSIDDNARGLIAALQYVDIYQDRSVLKLARNYFRYIAKAQLATGHFHNFANFRGQYLDKRGSQDSFGRTIWALGYAAGNPEIDKRLAREAADLLNRGQFNLKAIRFSRARAFALLGFYWVGNQEIVRRLANSLISSYNKNSEKSWHWFEETITYSNAILPYSLFLAYDLTRDKRYLEAAEESLHFLHRIGLINGKPAPIGQDGWYRKSGKRALYDQQCVDVADMVLASAVGWQLTGNKEYKLWAKLWWSWFFGNNTEGIPMYDEKTGGCRDGLKHQAVNLNQGAESVVCYLLAYLAMAKGQKR